MSSGHIIQIIGAVIDVEFERNSVPKIYDALKLTELKRLWKFSNNLVMVLFVQLRWDQLKVLNAV